ncbi:MAG: tRNA pseudouridine(55) synthase TruB [Candidatus Omnitrophica bacterium]|nr:tRNA pseudouridine(55) synthase TruB [Candidatus Omnitrophota bacterium]
MRDGILVVNKPKGMTSHDVVDAVRRCLGIRRVGHAGTLDPLATGVLVVLVGKCTSLFDRYQKLEKEYVAELTLGVKMASGDAGSAILERKDFSHITREAAADILRHFTGTLMQVPPMFSALKFKGKKLYELARKGIEVARPARMIEVKELKLLDFDLPRFRFYLKCSHGTYVRKLGEDIAEALGSVGYLSHLERHSVGSFTMDQAIELSRVNEAAIRQIPPAKEK